MSLAINAFNRAPAIEAIQILERLRTDRPSDSRCRRMLGEVYIRERQWDKAAAILREALTIQPTNSNLRRRYRAVSAPALLRPIKLAISKAYSP
jgi:Flp pilus assembly protein TadD